MLAQCLKQSTENSKLRALISMQLCCLFVTAISLLQLGSARPALCRVNFTSLHACPLNLKDTDDSFRKRFLPFELYPINEAGFLRSANSSAHGLNAARLEAAIARSGEPNRQGLTEELASPVNISVLGSSMTIGANCVSACGARGLDCAWPAQLHHLLGEMSSRQTCTSAGSQTRSTRGFSVHNAADHGKGSGSYATFGVGDLANADIVIVDCAVNDGLHSIRGTGSLPTFTEALIRSLLSLPSAPAVIYLATFTGAEQDYLGGTCAGLDAQEAYFPVVQHYGVPLISYRDLASLEGPDFQCNQNLGRGFGHPPWRIHQLVADTVAYFFEHSAAAAPKRAAPQFASGVSFQRRNGLGLPNPLTSRAELESASLCTIRMSPNSALETRPVLSRLDPRVTLETGDKAHGHNVIVRTYPAAGGWRCYDDTTHQKTARKAEGRPGWISGIQHTKLEIEVKTSHAGSVGISFLQSYEGFSGVRLTVDGQITTKWIGIQKQEHRGRGKREAERNMALDSGGIISGSWARPYSLPGVFSIRRLEAGYHVIALELLDFNNTALKEIDEKANFMRAPLLDPASSHGLGKFKLLGLVSC